MIAPAPAPPDRAAGRVTGSWDRATLALCQGFAKEAERARWSQYRSVWEYVEGDRCRRTVLLRHFGDRAQPSPVVPCCDVCAPEIAPRRPGRRRAPARPRRRSSATGGNLDTAIVEIVRTARPPVGRTRAVEILRGGRSKVIAQHAYDRLPLYGAFAHLRSDDVLGRVDELLATGTLRSSGGRFPKLRARVA